MNDYSYERTLTLEEIAEIPVEDYPFLVFADNIRGLFAFLVKLRTKGSYGHFMWLIAPDTLASQSSYFKLCTTESYANHSMKLVHNPNWTAEEKLVLISAILKELNKPWYKTMYDVVGVIGEFLGLRWMNLSNSYFCSERGEYLKTVDPEYDLKNPTPTGLNAWTKARQDRYCVYGRYLPD